VLHSFPEGPDDLEISRTYARLRFENGNPTVCFDWRQGHLFGMTNILGFLAVSAVPTRPGPMRLVPGDPLSFTTFRLDTASVVRYELSESTPVGPRYLDLIDVRGDPHRFVRRP